jgi:hypothetical protein
MTITAIATTTSTIQRAVMARKAYGVSLTR